MSNDQTSAFRITLRWFRLAFQEALLTINASNTQARELIARKRKVVARSKLRELCDVMRKPVMRGVKCIPSIFHLPPGLRRA
jgi:hypothetical protein